MISPIKWVIGVGCVTAVVLTVVLYILSAGLLGWWTLLLGSATGAAFAINLWRKMPEKLKETQG